MHFIFFLKDVLQGLFIRSLSGKAVHVAESIFFLCTVLGGIGQLLISGFQRGWGLIFQRILELEVLRCCIE